MGRQEEGRLSADSGTWGAGCDASFLETRQIPFSAKLVITNDEFYPLFVKRAEQVLLNMWHGGINYKKIGYDGLEFTNALQRMIYRMNNPCPDYFVSGSRKFTETTAESFRFPEKILCLSACQEMIFCFGIRIN